MGEERSRKAATTVAFFYVFGPFSSWDLINLGGVSMEGEWFENWSNFFFVFEIPFAGVVVNSFLENARHYC